METVSIIIPAYNMEAYIAETLTSVLTTDYPALEIIVVNDGSTNGTLEVAQSFDAKDKRIRVFSQKNGGAFLARSYYVCRIQESGL